jgi:class 3 adenylate cyclase
MTDRDPRPGRRLAAILMLDISGFSALMGRDEEATTRRVVALHEVVRGLVGAHGGRVVKTAGDSVFGEFDSIVEAAECAVAIQRNQAKEAEDGEVLMARIGLHVGDVIVQGDDLFGDGVNIAARIEPLAEPGGIAVSETVYLEIGARLGLPLIDEGSHHLKNIERAIRVYRVPPSALGFSAGPSPSPDSVDVSLGDLAHGVGVPAEKILGAISDAMDEKLRERRAAAGLPPTPKMKRKKEIPPAGALVVSVEFLVAVAVGVFLILAKTTGWTATGAYPFVGCAVLGREAGRLGESVMRRQGAGGILLAAGIAVGAVFLTSTWMRVVVWIGAVAVLAGGLQALGRRV